MSILSLDVYLAICSFWIDQPRQYNFAIGLTISNF